MVYEIQEECRLDEVTVDFTQEQARACVALFHTAQDFQKWLLLACFERNAHKQYGIGDFVTWVKEVLDKDWSDSTINQYLSRARTERNLIGVPPSMSILFTGEGSLNSVAYQQLPALNKQQDKPITVDWLRQLSRIKDAEAQKRIYNEFKGAMAHEQRTAHEYVNDLKRRVDAELKPKVDNVPPKQVEASSVSPAPKEVQIVKTAPVAQVEVIVDGADFEEEYQDDDDLNEPEPLTQISVSYNTLASIELGMKKFEKKEGARQSYDSFLYMLVSGWNKHYGK